MLTVKQAIEQLNKLPQDARLMVASLGHGGSVPLQGFIDLDADKSNEKVHWIDVIYCEEHERDAYLT